MCHDDERDYDEEQANERMAAEDREAEEAAEQQANPNRGRFVRGFDPRRKILTREDRARGYANAPSKIRARIRGLYKKGKWKERKETVWQELAE